jgi:uncharacterized protein (DUF488 family)
VAPALYTIGHSNIPAERFLSALAGSGIEAVIDVRTKPVSRIAPWANKARLAALLAGRGISYVFEGDALGGKPADPALQRDGQPDWAAIARTVAFAEAMARVRTMAEARPAAVLCSEEDPERCHRRHLIAAHLPPEWTVVDIRTAGPERIRAVEWERQLPLR